MTARQRFGIASRATTLAAAGLLAFAGAAQAAVFTKNATAGDLTTGTSWTNGTVPGGGDIALFNNTITAAQTDTITATPLTLGELQIVNPGGAITINGPMGLTLNGVNGVGIDMSAATQNLTIGAPVTLGASQAWNVAAGRILTLNSGTGFALNTNTLTLNGAGTVDFVLPNAGVPSTTTGALVVNNGTLEVYANTTNPTFGSPSNAIGGMTALTMGGGTITMGQGANVGTFTQNFASTTFAPGASAITQLARGASSALRFNFGTINRNVGGTLNVNVPATNNSGSIFGNGTNGIVGGFATYNGTDFLAFISATTVDTTANSAATYTADTWGGTTNTNVTLATNTQTAATTNSLRFAQAASDTVTLSGVNVISTGGILVSSAVTAGNADVINGDTLQGAPGADLIVNQFGAGTLAINAAIVDNTSPTGLTKTGTGTLLLGGANTFTGGVFINQGTIQMTAGGTLNGNALTFTNNSSGILTLNGVSTTIGSLSTSAVLPTTLPQVQNANANAATLTIASSTNATYAGNLVNGTGSGTLGLTINGPGVQTLTGTNSYTGPTVINGGTLAVTKTIASSQAISVGGAGTLDVSAIPAGLVVGSNNTLSGSGTVVGNTTIGTGANLTPGTLGTVGTLTLSGLTLTSASSTLNFDLNTGSNDLVSVTGNNGLTINGGQFNLSGTAVGTIGSVFDLFSYVGAVQGTGVSTLTVASGGTPGLLYTFGNDTANHFITLTISGGGVLPNYYVPDANGAYSAGTNWSAGSPPNATGAFAAFGGSGSTALTANRTVTVDGMYTAGIVSLSSTTGFGYTLASGGAGTGLILNNGSSTASLTDTAGSHTITAPLTLTANGATFNVGATADTLTVSGVISSDATTDIGLSKTGNGTLVLTGANTYFGGTGLNSGVIQINSAASLGDLSGNLVFGGGTLRLLADVTTPRNYQVNGGNDAVIDTNGHNLAFNGTITPVSASATGGLSKNGLGTLTMSGANTYTGATTVNAGVLSVAADAGLGAAPTAATTNVTVNAGTLQATAGFTLSPTRSITLGSATSTIDVENAAVVNYAGNISGSGTLNLTGNGTLAFSTAQSYTGNTVITGATLQYGPGTSLPGIITLNQGGTLSLVGGTGGVFPGNNMTVGAGANATINSTLLSSSTGATFTSGDANSVLNFNGPFSIGMTAAGLQFGTGYTGTVHLNPNATVRFSGTITGVGDGGSTTTFDLGAGSSIYSKNAGTVVLGALTGTGGIFGASTSGAVTTYAVGAKNLNTVFGGTINNNNSLTVTGTGSLTLTGANTYTGVTTVNNGATLQIDNGGTTGTLGTGTVSNSGTVNYNRSDVYTVANTFTGGGTLAFLGTGTKTLTGQIDQGAVNTSFGTVILDPAIGSNIVLNSLISSIAPNAGDNGTVTVQNSGSYNVNVANLTVGGLGTGTLNVNGPTAAGNGAVGGMVSASSGLTIGNGPSAVGIVNLNTGGTLTTAAIGSGGGSSTLNLNGGNLIVAAGASGTFMSGLTAANVQAGGAIINDGGNMVTITQMLSHGPGLGATLDGGLNKQGSGILTLSAANTYNGGTTVSAGTLTIATNGALSTGNTTVASGATLSLATGVVIAHNNGANSTTLTLADTTSIVNLAGNTGSVQDVVGAIVITNSDGAGTTVTYSTPGYYGSGTSGALAGFQIAEFTGSGLIGIGVLAPVPEPSTWALLLVGLSGLLLTARRVRCV